MKSWYPLKFVPVYKAKIWGGRRLASHFHRVLPEGKIGESWDVAAHPNGMSVVANGPHSGITLAELTAKESAELLGKDASEERFPLLVKIIDADDDLSVQVHPDDEYARHHEQGESGKTEMWYVLAAEEGARIVYGVKPDVTKAQFAAALDQHKVTDCLREVPARPGDVLHIPTGMIHALGKGVMVLEIQQNSDAVYRVYDWDRLDDQGKPRQLHIQKALDVIDFSLRMDPISAKEEASSGQPQVLVANKFFVVEKLDLAGDSLVCDLAGGFHILSNVGNPLRVGAGGEEIELNTGESCLIPAACAEYRLHGGSRLIRSYLP